MAPRRGVAIDGQGPYFLSNTFGPEANPQGGIWCAFVWSGQPARMAYVESNHWWILEIGKYNDRNKIELIRR